MNVATRWLSVDQLAEYLGISKETIYRWLEKGVIPAHKLGKLWRFETQEINEWIKSGAASNAHSKINSELNSNEGMGL